MAVTRKYPDRGSIDVEVFEEIDSVVDVAEDDKLAEGAASRDVPVVRLARIRVGKSIVEVLYERGKGAAAPVGCEAVMIVGFPDD